ncbi:MAG: DUF3971 domain-containing protein [Rhodospirillaceae bacterium]|nr:DUF3971 domain-containing protein [Rhodospirillaceae bacterium]
MSHGAVRYLLRVVEAVFLLAVIGAAILTWRLSQGPIVIDAIAPYVSEAFTQAGGGVKFQVDHLEFKWAGLKARPELTARSVRLMEPNGGIIASLPSMVVRLSPQALIRGVIAPDTVLLSNPIIRFVHRADGSLGLGSGSQGVALPNPAAAAPVVPTVEPTNSNAVAEELIRSLTRPASEENRAGYLDTVTIADTTLVLADELSGRRWIAPSATLTFTRTNGSLELLATLPVIEDGRRWTVTARGRYLEASRKLAFDVDIDGFRPTRVARLAKQLVPFGAIDLPVSGKAQANFTLAGNVARLDEITFDVKGAAGNLHLPAPVDKSYPVRALSLKGSASANLDAMKIDELKVELDRANDVRPVISVSAEGTNLNTAPHVTVRASMPDLSLAGLKDYWPEAVAPNTRDWIVNNLDGGGATATEFRMELDGPRLEELTASGTLLTTRLHDLSVAYMPHMPKVLGTDGVLTLTPGEVVIGISGGHVPDQQSGKGLRVTGGKVRLYGLDIGKERGDVTLDIAGEFGEAMRLVDHEPLGYAKAVGIDASQVAGLADVNLKLDFPLIKDLKRDQVEIAVKAKTTGVGIPNVAFSLPLNQGDFEMALTGKGMTVEGKANLGGIPSTVSWTEDFEGKGDVRSTYVLDPVINNNQRPLLGLSMRPFIPPYIDGEVPAHVTYVVRRDRTATLDAIADLTRAAVAIPELGWKKAEGKPAMGLVSARLEDDRLVEVRSFHVASGNAGDADALDVTGSATFADDNNLKTLTIGPSIAGESRMQAQVVRDALGAYTMEVSGAAFNSTYFWKELSRDDTRGARPQSTESTPLKLTAKFDRMWLNKEGDFKDVDLTFERGKAGIQALDFKSHVAETPFNLTLTSADGKRTFTGASENGGAVVRAVGLFKDIQGGQFSIKGEFEPNGTVKGAAAITNFKLVGAPPLARLLSVAALTGILDELRGTGISFSTLRAPFSYANSILTVSDGEMFGTSLGLTANGTYDFNAERMNFDGTLVPAYAVNSVLNSIPLVGKLFSGGDKGSGVFAATYSYRGDPATAQPSVNPLAALAPGFLRHIFDIFKSNPAQPAETKPAPEPVPSK